MAASGTRGRPRGAAGVAGAVLLAVVAVLWFVLGPGVEEQQASAPGPSAPTSASPSAGARDPSAGRDPRSGLPLVDAADLPAQARTTLRLIAAGGPFPYSRDGVSFGNREGLLPREPSGYYREYTVPTPGEDDRGARRIVAGDEGERYWTADHYDSFSRVRSGS